MGNNEPQRSEREDGGSSDIYPTMVCAVNTGRNVEDSYPAGSILINLGSGQIKWPGWINVDVKNERADIICDVKKLTFDDNFADVMCAIHMIEHLYFWEVADTLKGWMRVLKPGGKLVIECPCMDKVFAYILNHVKSNQKMSPTFSWFPLWGDPKYKTPEQVHKWGYTVEMLTGILKEAGFVNVKYEKPRYHFPNRDMRLEAYKP